MIPGGSSWSWSLFERKCIMTKFLFVTTLSIAGFSLLASDAWAGRCCRRQASCCCAPVACCGATSNCCGAGGCGAGGGGVTAPMQAPAQPYQTAPAPAPPQASTGGYQSYSYEPGGIDMSANTSLVATSGNVSRPANSFYE